MYNDSLKSWQEDWLCLYILTPMHMYSNSCTNFLKSKFPTLMAIRLPSIKTSTTVSSKVQMKQIWVCWKTNKKKNLLSNLKAHQTCSSHLSAWIKVLTTWEERKKVKENNNDLVKGLRGTLPFFLVPSP